MTNKLIFYALLFFSKEDVNPNLKVKSLNKNMKYNKKCLQSCKFFKKTKA